RRSSDLPVAHPAGDVHRPLHLLFAGVSGRVMPGVLRLRSVLDDTAFHLELPSSRVVFHARTHPPAAEGGRLVGSGAGFWCFFQERRNVSTASTRLDSLPVEGRPSFVKMLETYFSTARTVITRLSAMPWFELPAAISSSTSRSRGVS